MNGGALASRLSLFQDAVSFYLVLERCLEPDVRHIFCIKPSTTCRAFAASVLDVFVNALFAKHMPASQQNTLFVGLLKLRKLERFGALPGGLWGIEEFFARRDSSSLSRSPAHGQLFLQRFTR